MRDRTFRLLHLTNNLFPQDFKTIFKINGRAAVVVPDNILFEGGAGEKARRKLLNHFDVHIV
ncbi:MAG TPA: N-6 DNA methylase [Nitrososphaeraceae archaeon]|nr:N-6 DNA methylase [Nitrososphaeraceae archaeon]